MLRGLQTEVKNQYCYIIVIIFFGKSEIFLPYRTLAYGWKYCFHLKSMFLYLKCYTHVYLIWVMHGTIVTCFFFYETTVSCHSGNPVVSAENSVKVEKLNSKYIVSHQCKMKCRVLPYILLHWCLALNIKLPSKFNNRWFILSYLGFFCVVVFVVYNHTFSCRIGGQSLNNKPDVPDLMCASTFPWPLFYSSRFSLSKEELLHVPLSYLPSGHTSFFFFCSLNCQSFLLTPSINIYTGSHLILPYPSSLKLLFKSLSVSTAESSDILPQCKVFEEIFFFSLAPVLPEYLFFGVFFSFLFLFYGLILWTI